MIALLLALQAASPNVGVPPVDFPGVSPNVAVPRADLRAVTPHAGVARIDAAEPTPPDVLVVGYRLATLKGQLDACVARHCEPREEIAASLAYAKEQFLVGDYAASRDTLGKARDRNRRYVSQIPVEVSWVHHGFGVMKGLTGYVNDERLSMIASIDALRTAFANDDARVLLARLEIADAYVHAQRIDEAIGVYLSTIRSARRAHLPIVEGFAMFQQAILLATLANVDGTYRPGALAAARMLRRLDDPALLPLRQAGRIIELQGIDPVDRRVAAIDTAIAAMTPADIKEPFLLYAPSFDPSTVFERSDELGRPIWFDIRYTVGRDGRVSNVAVIRQSPSVADSWKAKVVALVAERRFMPMTAARNPAGLSKIERYSFVSDVFYSSGSHVPIRREKRRLAVIDIGRLATNVDPADAYAAPPI